MMRANNSRAENGLTDIIGAGTGSPTVASSPARATTGSDGDRCGARLAPEGP